MNSRLKMLRTRSPAIGREGDFAKAAKIVINGYTVQINAEIQTMKTINLPCMV